MKNWGAIVVLALAAAPLPAVAQGTLVIRGATVVDVLGEADIPDAVVVVRAGRIATVGSARTPVPAGARIIDARGKYLIPGLTDGHVHFFQSGGLYARPDAVDLRERKPYAKETAETRVRLVDTLHAYVRAGVTGAIDMGGPNWNFAVRRRAAADPLAPDVRIAGPLLSPYQPAALTIDVDPPILNTETVAQATAQAEAQARQRPDFLKFWYILGKDGAQAARERLRAMVTVARRARIPVAVHATERETARVAVAEGADVLVHSVEDQPIDDALVAAMKARGTTYIPTLTVGGGYADVFAGTDPVDAFERAAGQPAIVASFGERKAWKRPDWAAKAAAGTRAAEPVMAANLRSVVAAGIPVVMGTDAGNIGTLHAGAVPGEMAAMAAAGMSPRAVLGAATIAPARLLRRDRTSGSVTVGKTADLVLLRDDPRADIRAVATVDGVVRAGRWIEGAGVPDTAEAVVQRQVEAYNRHDIAAFAATYAPDVELYELGAKAGTPFLSGRDRMATDYGPFFAKAKPRATIVSRTVTGDFVTDHERVVAGAETIDAVAIYQVERGLIRRVWFTPVK